MSDSQRAPWTATPTEKRAALVHQRGVHAGLDILIQNFAVLSSQQMLQLLHSTKACASGVDAILSSTIEPKFYAEYRRDGIFSKPANRIFTNTELFEMILKYLTVDELMSGYTVSRVFRDTIEGSPTLQTILGLRVGSNDDKPHYRFGKEQWEPKGFSFHKNNKNALHERDAVGGISTVLGTHDTLPTIGTRWKRMLIVTPPIYSLSVHCECFGQFYMAPGMLNYPKVYTITSETGITVGDCYEAAERVLREHAVCPFLPPGRRYRAVAFSYRHPR